MTRCKECGKQLRSDSAICPFCKSEVIQNELPGVNRKIKELTFGYAALAILSLAFNPMLTGSWHNISAWPIVPIVSALFPVVMNAMLAVSVWRVSALSRAGEYFLTIGAQAMAMIALLDCCLLLFFVRVGGILPINIMMVSIVFLAIYAWLAVGVIRLVRSFKNRAPAAPENAPADVLSVETGDSGPVNVSSSGDDKFHAGAGAKKSRIITALSEIGLTFTLIGVITGSFIPLLDRAGLFIVLPAAVISCIGLSIAFYRKAAKMLAVAAVTISVIGLVITGWQYFNTLPPKLKVKTIAGFQTVYAQISSIITMDEAGPPAFDQYWSSKHRQLINGQYEQFFSDALVWPVDGCLLLYHTKSKEAIIGEYGQRWAGYKWNNPLVKKDESQKNDVWTVKFSEDDTEFEYTLIGHTYKLTGFYDILIGRDVEQRPAAKTNRRDTVAMVKNGRLAFRQDLTIETALTRYAYFNKLTWFPGGDDHVYVIGELKPEIVLQSAEKELSDYETICLESKSKLNEVEAGKRQPDSPYGEQIRLAQLYRSMIDKYSRKIDYTRSFIAPIRSGEKKATVRIRFVVNKDDGVGVSELCTYLGPGTGGTVRDCIKGEQDSSALNEMIMNIYDNKNIYHYVCPE